MYETLSSQIESASKAYERRVGQLEQLENQIAKTRADLASRERRQRRIEEATDVIRTVAQATQKELEYHVSELVSLALEAIFPDPYRLNIDFELRRNRSEADVTFSKEGEEKIDPMSSSGGGPIDVAAFGLRISLWSLQRPRSRPTIILDEPFRHVSRNLQPQASAMLKEISEKLGLQFVIVTHEVELVSSADKVFEVSQENRISEVEVAG